MADLPKTKRTIWLPGDLSQLVRAVAYLENRSQSDVIVEALQGFIEGKQKEHGRELETVIRASQKVARGKLPKA
ncbi:MAG: hypothetical protein JW819_09515 [Candidatus Krumholzibacteriota bacterium]|nr:hypothetical protein [Candidatus Krumholzibacteriota bacterium]